MSAISYFEYQVSLNVSEIVYIRIKHLLDICVYDAQVS